MVPDHAGRGDGGEDLVDDLGGVGAVGEGVEGEDEAVGDDVAGDGLDVVGEDVVASGQQGEGAGGGDEAEGGVPQAWRTVVSIAKSAIAERSKDLEVASWMTEAMLRLNGLQGLTAGAVKG